jgi:hypothetical protein
LQRETVQFKYMLSGYLPDGYLIRVSSLSSEASMAYRQQLLFVEALLQAVDRDLSARLLGDRKAMTQ